MSEVGGERYVISGKKNPIYQPLGQSPVANLSMFG